MQQNIENLLRELKQIYPENRDFYRHFEKNGRILGMDIPKNSYQIFWDLDHLDQIIQTIQTIDDEIIVDQSTTTLDKLEKVMVEAMKNDISFMLGDGSPILPNDQ
uniref:Uncharacterized protein n=1 Tax=Marseillevirus LCMAC201 TaxID=2506605 RepID=A0A481YX16_9VIRU|nr:MAG: hypothetical protein LCMAC201_04830 [Marseillevirus LCMAC201]